MGSSYLTQVTTWQLLEISYLASYLTPAGWETTEVTVPNGKYWKDG